LRRRMSDTPGSEIKAEFPKAGREKSTFLLTRRCQSPELSHNSPMRWPYLAFGTILAAGLFSSCGPTGGTAGRTHGRYTGPFDSHGNYREELADNPPSKGRSTTISNDEPPPDSVPLPPSGTNPAASVPISSKHKKKSSGEEVATTKHQPVEVASRTKHAASSTKNKHTEIASRDHETETTAKSKHKTTASKDKETDALPKSKHTSTATASTTTKSKHKETVSEDAPPKSKHKETASADAPPKTKHKEVADASTTKKKTTTSKKAGASHYTVKPGDSLERIARHSHTSVESLKSANGLSSDMIHPGKSLVIPHD